MKQLLGLVVLLCACRSCTYDPNAPPAPDLFEEPETLVDQVWEIGRFRVHEKIVRSFGIPDNTYLREYRVWADAEWAEMGTLRDEENIGIQTSSAPLVVDDHLAVFVGATTFIRAPTGAVTQVGPYDAPEFAEMEFNGHYDLRATDFVRSATRWRIQLEGPDSSVWLSSIDRGVTWTASTQP